VDAPRPLLIAPSTLTVEQAWASFEKEQAREDPCAPGALPRPEKQRRWDFCFSCCRCLGLPLGLQPGVLLAAHW